MLFSSHSLFHWRRYLLLTILLEHRLQERQILTHAAFKPQPLSLALPPLTGHAIAGANSAPLSSRLRFSTHLSRKVDK